MATQYIVGIDEVGRGPLAGPVTVGAVCVERKDLKCLSKEIPGVTDSKKLTEKKREEIFSLARVHKRVSYATTSVSAREIDQKGIVPAIKKALRKNLSKLHINPDTTEILLDGGLVAPARFTHQQTIIKGDQKEWVIGLASIMAKVTRDRGMIKLSKDFPEYSFEKHKGYGTKVHIEALRTHGVSVVHRVSFLRNI